MPVVKRGDQRARRERRRVLWALGVVACVLVAMFLNPGQPRTFGGVVFRAALTMEGVCIARYWSR